MTVAAPVIARTRLQRLRWALADGWTMTRRNLIHLVRQPEEPILGLAVPIIMVLVFGYVLANSMTVGNVDYVEFLMPGIFAMAVVMSLGTTAAGVALDVEKGVVDRFRSMPVAPSALLTGRGGADMLRAVPELALMMLCGLLIGWRWHGGIADMVLGMALMLLLRFALEWIGIFLGLIVPYPDMAGMVVYPLVFPLTAVSSALTPPQSMPGWLGAVAEWNPLSSTVVATRQLFGNPAPVADSWVAQHATLLAVVWPIVLVAIFLPLSVRRYRRISR